VPELMFNDYAEGGSTVIKIIKISVLKILYGSGQQNV
jgi:hypothetical protein